MAAWAAKKSKRTCKQCRKLSNPKSFAKGSRVKIAWVFDCKNCEVTKARPSPDNSNILELYEALPRRFDSAGIKVITASDIRFVFEVFEVARALWNDYYQRIVYFHNCLVDVYNKEREKELKRAKAVDLWKAKKLPTRKRLMRTH